MAAVTPGHNSFIWATSRATVAVRSLHRKVINWNTVTLCVHNCLLVFVFFILIFCVPFYYWSCCQLFGDSYIIPNTQFFIFIILATLLYTYGSFATDLADSYYNFVANANGFVYIEVLLLTVIDVIAKFPPCCIHSIRASLFWERAYNHLTVL